MHVKTPHQSPQTVVLHTRPWKSRLSTLLHRQKPAEQPPKPKPEPGPDSSAPLLPLLDFPNEILLIIAEHLENAQNLYYFLFVNRRLASLLTPLLHKSAVKDKPLINALHWAAWRGHDELAKFLLTQKGFSANFQDHLGMTALHWALERSRRRYNERVMRLLLDNGADASIKARLKVTVVHRAVQTKNIAALKLLLEYGVGAIIDVQEEDMGQTALHMAGELDYHWVLWGILLDAGASISIRDRVGRMPFHIAVQHGNHNMARALLERGARVNEQDIYGRAPLHWVSYRSDDFAMVELLLEKGANVNLVNFVGQTPLHLATQYQCTGIIKALLQKGADVELRDISGNTPIFLLEEEIATVLSRSSKWILSSEDRAVVRQRKEVIKLLKGHKLPLSNS